MNDKRPANPALSRKWHQFRIGAFFAFTAGLCGALIVIKPKSLTELSIGLTIFVAGWIGTGSLILWLVKANAKRK